MNVSKAKDQNKVNIVDYTENIEAEEKDGDTSLISKSPCWMDLGK